MKQATKTSSTFRMEYNVSINIAVEPKKIWEILTSAERFSQWNSTVISLEGKIDLGETLKLKVKIAPERTFKLKVTEFSAHEKMVWEDGFFPMFKGVRTYTLTSSDNQNTEFVMSEVFSGIMLPLIGGSLPDFRESFEQFAKDLKQEAENLS